jgi:signal transduction histidine kinase
LKLQILHKGLLLIFIPLLFQLVFFVQLFSLENQVEALEREEARQANMVLAMDQVAVEFGGSMTAIVCTLFGPSNYKLDPDGFKARLDKILTDVQATAEETPGTAMIMKEMKTLAQSQYQLYRELKVASEEQKADRELILVNFAKLKPEFNRVAAQCLAFKEKLTKELATLVATRKKNEANSSIVKQQILIGVLVDFAVAVLLLIAFLVDITQRLKVLVDNAQLLPRGKILYDKVSGSDELALLDIVLHDASEDLHSAKEYRKSLMEMVAHDLRSPLSTARSTVDILLSPSVQGSGEQSLKHLTSLKRSMVQLLGFVEDLLTIDRLESGKLELELSVFKIFALIDQCFDSLAIKADTKGLKLVREGEDCELVADQPRLTQVLMNLLTNAIKHSPDGGTVTVKTELNTSIFKLSVLDQGSGIPPKDQARIFEKFVQGRDANRKEGFGLGLAICKLIIDAHQGTIGLNSEAGKGSEFWFELSIDEDD